MRALFLVLLVACGQEPPTCADNLAIDLENFTVDGYNAVIKGGGGGTINTTWTCPGGGSATITGTANTQTLTWTLDWTFHMCVDTGTESTLTLDGALHNDVMNAGSLSTKVEVDHSDALTLYGNESTCKADPIDNTCVVDYTLTSSGNHGTICGIVFP